MYRWYKKAVICYAYLEDSPTVDESVENALKTCRWFTRGWTLQELIAPAVIEFYAIDWKEIGTKMSLRMALSNIAGIPIAVLAGEAPQTYNVAERFSWASARRTTRIEDEAYSLLGLFNVHMPLLYGEGSNAFQRLQEEILKIEEDYSIFAWPEQQDGRICGSLFSWSPAAFAKRPVEYRYSDLTNIPLGVFTSPSRKNRGHSDSLLGVNTHPPPPNITSRGISITLPVFLMKNQGDDGYTFRAAICAFNRYARRDDAPRLLCIRLASLKADIGTYERVPNAHERRKEGLIYNNNTTGLTLKRFTTKELNKFSYEAISVPLSRRFDKLARRIISSQDQCRLLVNLDPSTGTAIEITKVYRLHPSLPKTMLSLAYPLCSTSYFKVDKFFGLSGVIILGITATCGERNVIAVFFGVENDAPWCEGGTTHPGFDFERTIDDEQTQLLWRFYERYIRSNLGSGGQVADRWKGKLAHGRNGEIHELKITIRRAPTSTSIEAEKIPVYSLSISIARD